VIIQLFWRQFN